jgi:hypothetical protein
MKPRRAQSARKPGKGAVGKYGVPLASRRRALSLVRELQASGKKPTQAQLEVLSAGLPTSYIAKANSRNMREVMIRMAELESMSKKASE